VIGWAASRSVHLPDRYGCRDAGIGSAPSIEQIGVLAPTLLSRPGGWQAGRWWRVGVARPVAVEHAPTGRLGATRLRQMGRPPSGSWLNSAPPPPRTHSAPPSSAWVGRIRVLVSAVLVVTCLIVRYRSTETPQFARPLAPSRLPDCGRRGTQRTDCAGAARAALRRPKR